MRRREKPADRRVPLRLMRFNPADWPNGCHAECQFWDARWEWLEAGNELPECAEPGADAPFHPGLV